MEPKRNIFLGPSQNEIKNFRKRIKENDKIFDKRIKKIMNKLNK